MVILPVDQGFEHGPARSFAPNPEGYDPAYHAALAVEADLNAHAAPLGSMEVLAPEFAGQIPLILKANSHDVLDKSPDPVPAITASVEDAVRLGCTAIGFTIYPGKLTDEKTFRVAVMGDITYVDIEKFLLEVDKICQK